MTKKYVEGSPKQRLEDFIEGMRAVSKMDEKDERELRSIFASFEDAAIEGTIVSAFRGLRKKHPKGGE